MDKLEKGIKPDFHAKPIGGQTCPNCGEFDDSEVYTIKDIEAEREHYQKQLDLFAIERQDWNKSKTNLEYHLEKAEARAEAAEKKAKDFEDAAGAMSAELTEFGERAEKAEARVEKMQKELLEIANDTFFSWPCECDKMINATCEGCEREAYYRKKLEALAGEKTK